MISTDISGGPSALAADKSRLERVVHPSFSRFYELPYADHIPFQDGPDISLNGEISTFLVLPIKRNDKPLPSQIASGPHSTPASSSSFMALLRMSSKTGAGAPTGGLKHSSMRFLDFKRALLPAVLASMKSIHPEAKDNAQMRRETIALANVGGQVADVSRNDAKELPPIATNPAAQANLALVEASHPWGDDFLESLEEQEELVNRHLLKTTGLLLPTETQWYLLNELRIHAGAPERSPEGIDRLSHYYAQLLYLEPKFPFETDEIQMNFTWYEAYFSDRKVVTNCIQYEKASVLFNIAAVYATLASSHRLWTSDGKRKAAVDFQKAAGVLLHIRDRLCARFKPKLDRSSDLTESTLTALAELMLAQAVECFYEKANDKKASSGVTAKIAAQTADYYDVAHRAAESPIGFGKSRFPKPWAEHIKAKGYLFTAIAHMHTGPETAAETAVGERIARVSIAKDTVERAVKCSKEVGGVLHELVQGYASIIATAHSFLDNANFEKHHHPTYDFRLLQPLKRPQESLVLAAPIDQCVADPRKFKDMFQAIMSPAHHAGIHQVLDDCGRKVDAGRQELLGVLTDIDCKLFSLGIALPVGGLTSTYHPSAPHTVSNDNRQQTKLTALFNQVTTCVAEEDAFSGIGMLQSLEALIQLSQANISESFEIINGSSASVISDAIRELATTCNARLVEVAADCTDLRRKWDRGVGEIAGFTEDDIRSLLPSSIQSVQNPRLEGARRERDIWLRKLEDVRKLCEDKLGEINKLDRPGDDLTASSTAMSIDIHTTVASRQAQLRVLEDVLHVVVKDKENILRRIAELSRLLEDAGEDYAEEESSRELVDTLNTTVRKYIEWRGKAADALTSGLHIREDTCRLLARCLMFPKGPPGDDKPDGGDGGSGASLPPPPSGGKRDPLLAKYLTHSITSGATGTSSNPSPVAALETRLAEASPAPIPPYNPDVIGKAEHLAELRAAAAAAGIEMALICAPRHVETKNFTANVPSGSENNPHHIGRELGLRGLLRDQQEKLAQLMVEKAHRDLMLNRLQEQVQTQKLATHARQFADRYTDLDHSKEEPPIKSIIPVIAKRKPPGGGQAYVSEAGPSGTSDHKKRGKQPSCSPEIIDHGPGGKSHHGVKVTVEHALPETESEDQGSPSSVVDYDRLSIALSAISLSDYHPGTTPEQLLLSSAGIDVTKNLQHMDRLYSQIRVLIVARDALRSNNKRDLQKALSAVRKYHIRSEPAGNDSMSHWVWREMSDAGSRLTETLAALESRDLQPHPAPDFHKTADDSEDIGLEHLPLHARRQRQKERAGGHERLTTVMQTSSDAEVPDGFRNRRAPETRLGTPPDGRVSSWVAEQRKMSMQSNASDHTRSNSKKQDSAVPYEGIASAAAAAAAAGVSAALQYQRTSRNDDPNAGRSSVPTFKAPRRQPAGFTVGNRRKPSREPVAYPTVEDTAEEVSDAAEVPAAAAAEPAHRESHRSDRGVRRGYKQHNDFLVRELAGKDDYGRRH